MSLSMLEASECDRDRVSKIQPWVIGSESRIRRVECGYLFLYPS